MAQSEERGAEEAQAEELIRLREGEERGAGGEGSG